HDDFGTLGGLSNLECLQLSRSQCVRDEILNLRIPTNDIDFLVVEFAHDILNPLAPQSNTGPDRIHFFVTRVYGEFSSKTWLARDTFDFDGPVVDLRDFQLEKLDDKLRVGAGKDDFRAMDPI